MKLPNVEQALVPRSKIVDYLLSEENSNGKSAFFTRFGFSVAEWEVLAYAIYNHAAEHEVDQVLVSKHGMKYLVEGPIATPDKRNPYVRTVWLIEHGMDVARFISAYPVK